MRITAQAYVSEMTYTVLSGTLKSTIPYHTIRVTVSFVVHVAYTAEILCIFI